MNKQKETSVQEWKDIIQALRDKYEIANEDYFPFNNQSLVEIEAEMAWIAHTRKQDIAARKI